MNIYISHARRRLTVLSIQAIAVACLLCPSLSAHEADSSELPALLRNVSFTPLLGAPIPMDLEFRDEQNQPVRLRDYAFSKPLILDLTYFHCRMLCDQELESLAGTLRAMSYRAGKDLVVLALSFDPRDLPADAAEKKLEILNRPSDAPTAAGWHFLTGNAATIAALTDAVQFRYANDEAEHQFAHASGLLVLTPEGRISRFLSGIDAAPRDLRLSLIEASANRIGSATDRLLLFCYHYDPAAGKYTAAVLQLIRWGGIVTVFGIGALLFTLRKRSKSSPMTLGRKPC